MNRDHMMGYRPPLDDIGQAIQQDSLWKPVQDCYASPWEKRQADKRRGRTPPVDWNARHEASMKALAFETGDHQPDGTVLPIGKYPYRVHSERAINWDNQVMQQMNRAVQECEYQPCKLGTPADEMQAIDAEFIRHSLRYDKERQMEQEQRAWLRRQEKKMYFSRADVKENIPNALKGFI